MYGFFENALRSSNILVCCFVININELIFWQGQKPPCLGYSVMDIFKLFLERRQVFSFTAKLAMYGGV